MHRPRGAPVSGRRCRRRGSGTGGLQGLGKRGRTARKGGEEESEIGGGREENPWERAVDASGGRRESTVVTGARQRSPAKGGKRESRRGKRRARESREGGERNATGELAQEHREDGFKSGAHGHAYKHG